MDQCLVNKASGQKRYFSEEEDDAALVFREIQKKRFNPSTSGIQTKASEAPDPTRAVAGFMEELKKELAVADMERHETGLLTSHSLWTGKPTEARCIQQKDQMLKLG